MRIDELRTSGVWYARQREALIAATGMDEDDECLRDTLEGATDLQDMLARAIREAKMSEAFADGLKAIIAENNERRQRLLTRVEKIRNAVALMMQDAGLTKIVAADVTLSLRMSKPAPKIIDADALPEWARVEKRTFTPDRDAIKEAYELDPEGFSIPGVVITNAAPVLTVRAR